MAEATTPGALPRYLQISALLIREIEAGRLLDGERLPPERELARTLGVAVGTLRKALSEMERRGRLERRHGSGNYVRAGGGPAGVYAFFRLELAEGGGLPTAEALDLRRMTKPADLPDFGASEEAHRIRRLRRLNRTPVAVEEIWLDGACAETLEAKALSESLYLHYETALGLRIARVEDRVGVGGAPDWAPETFAPAPGAPCGLVERLSRAEDDRVVEFSRNWFDADRARYVSRIR